MNKPLPILSLLPRATPGESPTLYADRLGQWYGQTISESHRKFHGHYLTPPSIAAFMGQLACQRGAAARDVVRILDPAAGSGTLAAAACQALGESSRRPSRIELVAYEIDPGLESVLGACFDHLRHCLANRGIELLTRVEMRDFILANSGVLEGELLPSAESPFDAVICNPPYFKIPKADPRAQACRAVVHGQPNIYGLFMAVSAALLQDKGKLVFITPRSFASGPYFQRLRETFFDLVRPTDMHVFASRTDAFDDVLQETVITCALRQDGWGKGRKAYDVRISSSTGADDIAASSNRTLPIREILRGDCRHRVLYLPANTEQDRIRTLVNAWPGSLHAYGWEVSTGPVVAFRARQFLLDGPAADTIPLLWLQNVTAMTTFWPIGTRKSQYLRTCRESKSIVLPSANYVLLRRFSAKEERRRLTAAPYIAATMPCEKIGFENHLNYIHKPGGSLSLEEIFGLAALLNSRLMDTYFRIGNGNTQVSATELRATPLPALKTLHRIGRQAMANPINAEAIVLAELHHGH